MKRIITYLSVFAALLAVSCNRMEPSDFTGESDVVRFALSSSGMETRAITVNDDPNSVDNENVINTVDYFFFKNVEGTTVLVHDSKTFAENEERILSFDTTKDAYKSLRKPFYAYFLVNYKDAKGKGIDHSKTWTLEQLLNLPIVTNFLPKDKEGKEEKIAEFVMDSGNKPIYVRAEEQGQTVEKKISLYHVAAKIVLNMTVAQSVTGLDDTWTPVMDQVTLRFWNALKTATVKAEPVERTETSQYINYPDEKPTKSGTSYTSRIFYTYPQLFGTKSDEGKVTYKNGEPYFKMTFVWKGAKVGATRFYYKILLPNLEKIERNKYYVLNVNINELGGVEDEYVKVSDHYYVVDWQSPAAITQAGVTESRFLDIALPVYSFYGKDEMNVPVISSHPIRIVIDSATKEVFKEGVDNTVSQDAGYPKTNANTDFTLKHTLVTDVTRTDYDCGIITYEVTVYHADDESWKKTVIIKQYPPVYLKQEDSNGSVFVNAQSYYDNLGYKPSGADGYYVYEYNGDFGNNIGAVVNPSDVNGNGDNNNQHQYTVYVSVLPSSNPNQIGDPRVGSSKVENLGISAEYTYDNSVSDHYKAAGDNTQNVIAPAFKIASSYGKTTSVDYKEAKERCASYQENGYPAGRWRLPTAAEIDFVISLSDNKHIPTLFGAGRHDNYSSTRGNYWYNTYWAGGMFVHAGKQYQTDTGYSPVVDLNSAGDYTSGVGAYYRSLTIGRRTYRYHLYTRCVYDVWYWGEEQDSDHLTTWGGFQMD